MILKYPNLPKNKVKTMLISRDADKQTCKTLDSLGIELIKLDGCASLDGRIRNHPDMNFLHLSQNAAFTICENKRLNEIFGENIRKIEVGKDILKYPHEAGLNCFTLLEQMFYGKKSAYNEVKEEAIRENFSLVSVKQGYVKCSTCIVSENAIMTEDFGIYKAANKFGVDALLLEDYCVELAGFDRGFIGGACGKISKDVLAFDGDISKHTEYVKIENFCNLHGVKIMSLSDGNLTDIGSLVPIEEF